MGDGVVMRMGDAGRRGWHMDVYVVGRVRTCRLYYVKSVGSECEGW